MDILAFFAHPDDETMLCGGTLALLARRGAHVHILSATRGEGGEMGDPPLCTRENLGSVRESELNCAAIALGTASLTVMDYTDPTVGPGEELYAFTGDVEGLAVQIVEAIHYRNAGAIITHGVNGEYGHPAHKLAHRAVLRAVEVLGDEAPLLYTVQATFPDHPYPRLANADAPAHLLVDVTPVLKQKTDAALCHRTQHDLFIRHRSEEAGRRLTVPEVIMPIESLHRVYPPVKDPSALHDPLANLLLASGIARRAG
jgi:N-acetylglucosamine malate deacetylase 2